MRRRAGASRRVPRQASCFSAFPLPVHTYSCPACPLVRLSACPARPPLSAPTFLPPPISASHFFLLPVSRLIPATLLCPPLLAVTPPHPLFPRSPLACAHACSCPACPHALPAPPFSAELSPPSFSTPHFFLVPLSRLIPAAMLCASLFRARLPFAPRPRFFAFALFAPPFSMEPFARPPVSMPRAMHRARRVWPMRETRPQTHENDPRKML